MRDGQFMADADKEARVVENTLDRYHRRLTSTEKGERMSEDEGDEGDEDCRCLSTRLCGTGPAVFVIAVFGPTPPPRPNFKTRLPLNSHH